MRYGTNTNGMAILDEEECGKDKGGNRSLISEAYVRNTLKDLRYYEKIRKLLV